MCNAALGSVCPSPACFLPRKTDLSSPRSDWHLLLHPSATCGFTSASAEVMSLLPNPSCSHVDLWSSHGWVESCGAPGSGHNNRRGFAGRMRLLWTSWKGKMSWCADVPCAPSWSAGTVHHTQLVCMAVSTRTDPTARQPWMNSTG